VSECDKQFPVKPSARAAVAHSDYYLSVLRIGKGGDATKIPVGLWSYDATSVAKTKFVPYGLYYCDDGFKYWIAQLGGYAPTLTLTSMDGPSGGLGEISRSTLVEV